MRYIHAFGTLALASVVMLGATFRAEAAYRKGKLLWKCEFTQADVEKYGLGKYRIGKDGTGCEVRPSEGKNGALCFVGHSKVKIAPDVKLDGLIYVESDVMGLDIAQTDPEARDSRLGPAVIMNYIRYKKSRGKTWKSGASRPFPLVRSPGGKSCSSRDFRQTPGTSS